MAIASKFEAERLPTLDGWRAVAILSVLVCHTPLFTDRVQEWQAKGSLGVDLFFAISGLLITYWLVTELQQTGGIDLKRFYIKRAFRILPAALLYLAVITALSGFRVISVDGSRTLASALFYRNYYFGGMGDHDWFTGHFWSLSVEEHFYLIWPFLLVWMGLGRARTVAPVLAIAAALWRTIDCHFHLVSSQGLWFLFTRTDYRIDALLWGCAAGLLLFDPKWKRRLALLPSFWPVVCLAAIVLLAFFQPRQWMTLTAILFPTVVCQTVLNPSTWLAKVLECAALRFLGQISYGLYLWQQLFFIHDNPPQFHVVQSLPGNLVCAVLAAWLSFRFVEEPLRTFGKRLASRPAVQASPPARPVEAPVL